jgi:phosphatidylglycerophosphate synthase
LKSTPRILRPIDVVQLRSRRGRVLSQAANLMSLSRFALAALWLVAFLSEKRNPQMLAPIALLAALSDFLDGPVAHRTNSAHAFGRWLDSVADIAFILTALSCEALAGAIPAYIPALVAVSFAQYAIDSIVISGSLVPVKSRIGHWGGVVNFGLVILLAMAQPLRLPTAFFRDVSPLLAIFYLAAIVERAANYRQASAVRGLP